MLEPGQLTQVLPVCAEDRNALLTRERGTWRKMLADILVFWVVGVPAAVLSTTELGARLRKRAASRTSLTSQAAVALLSPPFSGPFVHGHLPAALMRRAGCPRIRVRGDSACRESF
jgi:hypothetical protein